MHLSRSPVDRRTLDGAVVTFAAISYGGGVQSTAMVVLACTGRIRADVALFANVGDRAEYPPTLAYVRDVAIPWAAERGLPIVEVAHHGTPMQPVDLHDALMSHPTGYVPIPMMRAGSGPMHRVCTDNWKVRPIERWIDEHVDAADVPADVLVGISVDEIERAGRSVVSKWQRRKYPLLDLGLNRFDCEEVIRVAGLPVPPKSACYFCPYHRPAHWSELRRDEPDLFERTQEIEDSVNERRLAAGNAPVYFVKGGRRLSDAVRAAQGDLFASSLGEDGCDEGVCFV